MQLDSSTKSPRLREPNKATLRHWPDLTDPQALGLAIAVVVGSLLFTFGFLRLVIAIVVAPRLGR